MLILGLTSFLFFFKNNVNKKRFRKTHIRRSAIHFILNNVNNKHGARPHKQRSSIHFSVMLIIRNINYTIGVVNGSLTVRRGSRLTVISNFFRSASAYNQSAIPTCRCRQCPQLKFSRPATHATQIV